VRDAAKPSGISRLSGLFKLSFCVGFSNLEYAFHFPVVAAGLLPVCAKDLTVPDRPRLEMLVDAIRNCRYSVHEFSRATGEGPENFARMNMPLEMGMALFHALETQRREHRCAFFVPTPYDYHRFMSDLAGLDPQYHNNDSRQLVSGVYEWLRSVVPAITFNSVPTIEVARKYDEFCTRLQDVCGSGEHGKPTHDETREIMYQMCAECGWWDWRNAKPGSQEFPPIPLAWR
jgi:hypothetical protein